MSTKYRVRQVEMGAHAEDVTALWSRCLQSLTPQEAFGRLHHRYLGNPAGAGAAVLLQPEDAQCSAGVQCLHARRVHHEKKAWRVAGLADYAVDERHRTLGPAVQLMKQGLAVARSEYDWVYGLPNAKSEAVCKRTGLKKLGHIDRWTRLLHTRAILSRRLPAPIADLVGPLADALLRLRDALRMGAVPLRWEHGRKFPAALDTLWQGRRTRLAVSERSRKVLEWRFADAPGRWTVSLARLPDGTPCGYVVWEIVQGVAEVADFFCADPQEGTAPLLVDFARQLRSHPVQRVSLEFFGSPAVSEALRQAGFLQRHESQPLYVAAGRREPPAAGRWYFTAFDRDGD
jgi:hypothetical protein